MTIYDIGGLEKKNHIIELNKEETTMDKWYYIERVREYSRLSGKDMLLLLMDKTNKNNLAEITYEESKDFYYFILKEYKGK